MAILLRCPGCNQQLTVDSNAIGRQAKCPQCQTIFNVSDVAAPTQPVGVEAEIFCPMCGRKNLENNYKCTSCEYVLHGSVQSQYKMSDDSTMGGLIPYKNPQALWAYYVGIFSLIPCLGIPMGITALVLGIRGLAYANAHPEAKGKIHAWVGIITGGLFAVLYSALVLIVLLAILNHPSR